MAENHLRNSFCFIIQETSYIWKYVFRLTKNKKNDTINERNTCGKSV